ncbi:MAG: hypothetical protein Ct9H300mP9_3050 [Candidatus Neomarinimicrobiota bacterium]|nr:MAG: hypothetical protein Ct9H300mP9_3050 [Candidatus Neomarinimicrobiota bacterium]
MSEYANMFVVSGVAATGFLGGWQSPKTRLFQHPLWGKFWMLSKTMFLVFMMIWMRWTFPVYE